MGASVHFGVSTIAAALPPIAYEVQAHLHFHNGGSGANLAGWIFGGRSFAVQITSPSANSRTCMKSFSLENTIENLSHTNAVYEFPYLLIYLHYRNKKREEIHKRTQMACQMAGWKSKINNSSTTEFELWRNAGPSAFQFRESVLKSDKI